MVRLTTPEGVATIDDQLKVTGPKTAKEYAELMISSIEGLHDQGLPPLTVLYHELKRLRMDVEADPETISPGADQPKGTVF